MYDKTTPWPDIAALERKARRQADARLIRSRGWYGERQIEYSEGAR